jgi:phosphonate transport system substrate-binding protein
MSKLTFKMLLFSLICSSALISQTQTNKREAQPINVGFSIDLFNQVDIRDASVAIEMWGDELLGELGIKYYPETKIFNTNQEILDALKNNKLDLISLLTTDYLEIAKEAPMEPYLITTVGGSYGYSFLLLVRKDNEIKNLMDLKGKQINVPSDSFGKLVNMWLTTTLHDKGEKFNTFFSEVKEVNKPSQALFPVFFKQADACVIPEQSFNTMLELNPQLKNDLLIIDTSPELVNGIMCINDKLENNLRETTTETARKLSHTDSGKQILTLFKSEELLKFKPEHIKSTKELFDKYKKITK